MNGTLLAVDSEYGIVLVLLSNWLVRVGEVECTAAHPSNNLR